MNISLQKKQIKRDFLSLNLDTQQGRNEGARAAIYRALNHYGAFVPKSTFSSERSQVRTWGRQTFFLPRAPYNLVTPLTSISTNKANLGGKKRSGSPGPKAFWRNLKGTFEDLLPCCCCAVQTNSRTIREQGAQPAPTGKGEGTSELQSHHCMAPEQWTWLLSSVIVSVIYRQINCHCNNLVNYSQISC